MQLSCKIGTIIIPILQMRKLRGHTHRKPMLLFWSLLWKPQSLGSLLKGPCHGWAYKAGPGRKGREISACSSGLPLLVNAHSYVCLNWFPLPFYNLKGGSGVHWKDHYVEFWSWFACVTLGKSLPLPGSQSFQLGLDLLLWCCMTLLTKRISK